VIRVQNQEVNRKNQISGAGSHFTLSPPPRRPAPECFPVNSSMSIVRVTSRRHGYCGCPVRCLAQRCRYPSVQYLRGFAREPGTLGLCRFLYRLLGGVCGCNWHHPRSLSCPLSCPAWPWPIWITSALPGRAAHQIALPPATTLKAISFSNSTFVFYPCALPLFAGYGITFEKLFTSQRTSCRTSA
jgi:hypothetical protein